MVEKYTLKTPIRWEDKEIKKLEYDFDNLTGEDLINADQDIVARRYKVANVSELSKPYLASVFAVAAKVPLEMILRLKPKDFTSVTYLVMDFLLD